MGHNNRKKTGYQDEGTHQCEDLMKHVDPNVRCKNDMDNLGPTCTALLY